MVALGPSGNVRIADVFFLVGEEEWGKGGSGGKEGGSEGREGGILGEQNFVSEKFNGGL